jgi:hypothetical protein
VGESSCVATSYRLRVHTVSALVFALVALGCGAQTAGAETLPATCANLQSRINTASTSAGADTVVLGEMCKAAVKLPAHSDFTLEGAAGTTSGLNGEGVSGHLLETSSEIAGAMTISNLTFEHATAKTFVGGALYVFATSLTLSHDHFTDDTVEEAEASGGGAYVIIAPAGGGSCEAHEPAALTVTESSFVGDTAKGASGSLSNHGGGLDAIVDCGGRASYLTRDTFEGDNVTTTDSAEAEGGGAALLDAATSSPGVLYQEGNVFDSNTVTGPAEGNRGGGGEWLEGINLTSVGDRFSRDSIPGTTAAKWSWGGGLGILNTSCISTAPTESTLENAVVAGNMIGAGTPADLGGAGIYVGIACGPEPEHHSHLRLLDSTVTENSVATAGGVAGIDGHPADQLALANSIVSGDQAGAEIGGFTGTGGSLTNAFSDVCDEAGTAPLPGEGDICAAPKLADEGNPGSFDVHETELSPTIDAGSNALLPTGLSTDLYGNPRVSANLVRLNCSPNPALGPAVVDMGAAEYVGRTVNGPAPPCVPVLELSSFAYPASASRSNGLLALSFRGLAAGKLTVLATFKHTRTIVRRLHGKRHVTHKTETVVYAQATHTTTSAGNVDLSLKPSKRALALLRALKKLKLSVKITFLEPGRVATAQIKTVTVRYIAPRRHH